MKYRVYDFNNTDLLFSYEDGDSVCKACVHDGSSFQGICKKGNYRYLEHKNQHVHCFCMSEYKTRKDAKHFSKILIESFYKSIPVQLYRDNEMKNLVDIKLHNTRGLVANLNTSLDLMIDYSVLSHSTDKPAYIKGKIASNQSIGRDLLKIIKIITNINNEYYMMDYLNNQFVFSEEDFSIIEIHKLMILSFYQYEYEFKQKRVFVEIKQTRDKIHGNFASLQIIFSQLFENALKYTLPDNTLEISFRLENKYLVVVMSMVSATILKTEISSIGMLGFRGAKAKHHTESGEGVGMYIIKQLIEKNEGGFEIIPSDTTFSIENKEYGNNIFLIRLIKADA